MTVAGSCGNFRHAAKLASLQASNLHIFVTSVRAVALANLIWGLVGCNVFLDASAAKNWNFGQGCTEKVLTFKP